MLSSQGCPLLGPEPNHASALLDLVQVLGSRILMALRFLKNNPCVWGTAGELTEFSWRRSGKRLLEPADYGVRRPGFNCAYALAMSLPDLGGQKRKK